MYKIDHTTDIICDACGSSCKTTDTDIFEYCIFEKINKESQHFCIECSKKIEDFIKSISNTPDFNL